MTVDELISKLLELPGSYEVKFPDSWNGPVDARIQTHDELPDFVELI